MFGFRELDDYSSKEQCSMSQFSFANEVERTASFSIILDFLLHILKMKLEKKRGLKDRASSNSDPLKERNMTTANTKDPFQRGSFYHLTEKCV